MKLANLLLLWVATICVCTAVPPKFGGPVTTQQVDVDECAAETVIQIPKWFCTNILLENRPQWLRTICDTVQQSKVTKVQQTTGGERTLPNWICEILTEEKRRQQINNICSAIRNFNLQGLFGISKELCALGDSIAERVLEECGSPTNPEEDERARTFARRRRRWTGVGEEVQTQQTADPQVCSYLGNPELLPALNAVCGTTGIIPEDYGIPQIVCDANPERRIEVLRAACTQIRTIVGSKVQTQQTAADPRLCSHLADPDNLLPVLNTVCGLTTVNPADYIPQIICDAEPENRIKVLERICTPITGEKRFAMVQQFFEVPPYICEVVGYPDFLSILITDCRVLHDIPNEICDLPPQQRVQAIEGRCVATSMNGEIAKDQQMTKVPKWLCDSIPELGLPKWLSNMCEMNERLPTAGEICNDQPDKS